jgi:hypothetical protein
VVSSLKTKLKAMHHIHREIARRDKQLLETKVFIQKKDRVHLYQLKPAFRGSNKKPLLCLPTEASLQKEQQDAPPAAPSTRIDKTTTDEQHDLRESTRQYKPIQRLIEAMHAELQDQPIPGEIFSFQAMFPGEQVDSLLDVNPFTSILSKQ